MPRYLPKILVVDDEAAMREVLELRLERLGFEVALAEDGHTARRQAEVLSPDLVLSDVVLPDTSGLELLRWLKAGDPRRPVVLMTAYGTIDAAVEALKHGAHDFLTKPLDYGKLETTLAAAREDLELRTATRDLERQLEGSSSFGLLVGQSKPMRELYKLVAVLAESHASAILTGESGTGKEMVARTVHNLSSRKDGPFVALNTAALPEGITESELFGHERGAFTGAVSSRPGCFEMANAGTLLLDELAEMPLPLQPKLLRILEESSVRRLGGSREVPFDVRVLAATNRDLEKALEDGQLREDLFYRLNVFTLELPPLRERADDLPLLAQHFVHRFNDKHGTRIEGTSREALEMLAAYPWPGNVRELRNIVERGVILARRGWLEAVHLPPYVRKPKAARPTISLPAGASLAEAERILIRETLKVTGNNKAETARQLGLDVKTIRNKLRLYGDDAFER